MAFDPVPWLVEGGAEHSARLARTMIYYFTGGQEGILNSESLRVQALDVPGSKVRIMPGVATIKNRALGSPNECYMMRAGEESPVDITATGSGGSRTDLIVARVENPHISGEPWQLPSDSAVGPYVFPRVISNVPAGIRTVHELDLGYSAISLAKVTIPANTATITNAMITDLRSICNPITGPMGPPGPPGAPGAQGEPGQDAPDEGSDPCPTYHCHGDGDDGDNGSGDPCPTSGSEWWNWPANATWTISIPSWATHLDVDVWMTGVQLRVGSLSGIMRLLLGGVPQFEFPWRADYPGGTVRLGITGGRKDVYIPPGNRGKTFYVQWQAKPTPGSWNAQMLATNATQCVMKIRYKQMAG